MIYTTSMENKKICSKCNLLKSTNEFYIDRRFNIFFSRCKSCYNLKCSLYRKSKKGKKTYNKWVKSETGHNVRKKAMLKWRMGNPNHRKAVYFVKNAIRDGRLIRKPCEICGDISSEAHHNSYEKEDWLNVKWLCKKHHVQLHHSKPQSISK